METTESWRPVVGFEGLYEVSDQGRVRSLDRVTTGRWGAAAYRGRMLLPDRNNPDGYERVTLQRAGKRIRRAVHHLVLEAFVGPRPDEAEACHGDGDPANNVASNLRWDTHSANIRDKRAHGTDYYACRDSCSRGHLYMPGSYRIWRGARRCIECDRIRQAAVRAARGRVAP